jgi:hypothetical protein
MQKTSLLLSFLLLSIILKAQIQNPSFEHTDSLGALSSWQQTAGKFTQLTSVQFGMIPFTAYDGNFFALLESDTQTSVIKKGTIEQTFAFADTPGNFSFRYFYIPESLTQHGQVEMYMSKWNGTSRDTVLYSKNPIAAVADSNQIRIQWNEFATTLKGIYRQPGLPDTATIRFVNDDGAVAGKNIRLYLDALQFGRWATGIKEADGLQFSVYPNPASNWLTVKGDLSKADCLLIGTDGKQYTVSASSFANGMNLDISTVPGGFYVLYLQTDGKIFTKRIIINHE